jgi:tetratricopeptide (TPR) repeat protein
MTMRRFVLPLVATMAIPAMAADRKVEEACAKAESQLVKGRTDEAEKTMLKLVRQQPSAESYACYTLIQLKAGNEEGAAASSAEAVKLAGGAAADVRARVHAAAAELALRRGSGKDAVTHAQEAVAAAPTPDTLAVLARAQARVGDPASVATAQKAVEAGASSAAAHEALGHAFLAVQRGDEAMASFRKALELDVKRSSARTGLASALLLTGKAADAVTEARRASEEDARSGDAFAVLGTALLAAAPNRDAGWNEAIAQAQQGAFLSPRNPVVQTAVGAIFEAGGNPDQAARSYTAALEADPGYAPAQLSLLHIESRRDLDKAIERARLLARQQPQDMSVQLTLGTLLARKGEWTEALEPLKKAAAALSSNAEAQALVGTAYQHVGESDDALAAYEKAVELAPNNLEYRTTYGLLLGLNQQHKAGIAELQKVTSTAGYKDPDGWVNLGWLYRDIDPPQTHESMAAYRTALQIDPKNSPAAVGLAWAALVGKKFDEAIAAFTKAMEVDKANTVVALNGIGWGHYFKKDMEKAEAFLQQATTAGRGDPRLASAIEDFREKGEQELERQKALIAGIQTDRGDDVDSLCSQLTGGRAVSAAVKLGRLGKPAVSCLIWAARNARNTAVQQAAITSLGTIGGAAREACPHLQGMARVNPYEQTIMSNEQQDKWVGYEDIRRAARVALGRIGC